MKTWKSGPTFGSFGWKKNYLASNTRSLSCAIWTLFFAKMPRNRTSFRRSWRKSVEWQTISGFFHCHWWWKQGRGQERLYHQKAAGKPAFAAAFAAQLFGISVECFGKCRILHESHRVFIHFSFFSGALFEVLFRNSFKIFFASMGIAESIVHQQSICSHSKHGQVQNLLGAPIDS